ncbi:MAG TPA: hypothetical protein VEL05_00560, partial [Candidatus Acidoferrum sp.]|nr:hypothetical protein [Candidatus Acidoferrum sp.]
MATKPLLGPPVRLALQWGFLVWTFAAALHFNVVRPYLLRGRQLVGRSSIARASVRTYDGAMDAAEVVGMAS